MRQEQFEKDLRSKFKNYSPSIDEAVLWSEIEQALPNKTKERALVYWFLFPILLIAFGFYFFSDGNFVTDERLEIVASEAVINQNLETNNSNEDTQVELIVDTDTPQLESNSFKINESKDLTSSLIVSKKARVEFSDIDVELVTEKVAEKFVEYSDKASGKYLSEVINNSSSIVKPLASKVSLVAALPQVANRFTGLSLEARDFDKALKTEVFDSKETSTRRWFLDWSLGGGILQSAFSSQFPEASGLETLRTNNEQQFETFGTTVLVNYRLNQNWSLGLGLAYTKLVTGSEIESITTSEISLIDTSAVYYNGVSTTIETGPRDFIETTTRLHQRYNTYSQLTIPVKIYYSNQINNSWGYRMGLGYTHSVWSKASGYDQDLNQLAYNLTVDGEKRLRKNGSNRLILESSMTYTRAQKSMYFGLTYLPDLNGIYVDNYLIQKKIHLLHFNAGVIIPLNFKK